jgi:hypothetical protein
LRGRCSIASAISSENNPKMRRIEKYSGTKPTGSSCERKLGVDFFRAKAPSRLRQSK